MRIKNETTKRLIFKTSQKYTSQLCEAKYWNYFANLFEKI